MRPVDAVGWADCLDVKVAELPSALMVRLRRLNGVRHELTGVHQELADCPDAELCRSLVRSLSALCAAEAQLHLATASAQRTA